MTTRKGQQDVELCDIPDIVEMSQYAGSDLGRWKKEDIEDLEKELKRMHESVSGFIKSISDSPFYGGGDYISLKRYEEELAAAGLGIPTNINDSEDFEMDESMDASQIASADGSEDYLPSAQHQHTHAQQGGHHRGGRASAVAAAATMANALKKSTKGRRSGSGKHKKGNDYESIFENDTPTTALSSTPSSKFWTHMDEVYFRKIKDSEIDFLTKKSERKSLFTIPQLPAHKAPFQLSESDESLLPSGPSPPPQHTQQQQLPPPPPPQSQQMGVQGTSPQPQFVTAGLASLPLNQQQQIQKDFATVGPFTQRLLAAFLETPKTQREEVLRLRTTYGDNPDTPEYRYYLEQSVKAQLERTLLIQPQLIQSPQLPSSSSSSKSSKSKTSASPPSSTALSSVMGNGQNMAQEDDEVCEELRLAFRMLKRHQKLLSIRKGDLHKKITKEKECQNKREKDKRDTFAMIRLYREREQHRKGREKHGRHK